MKEIIESLGGRKFVFAIVLVVGMFSLALAGKISFDQLTSVCEWIFGIFVTGNVGQKFATPPEA